MNQVFIKASPEKSGIALVFSGGGARGAFEYGVWTALRELGTISSIEGISGTSIGALNTLFYIQRDFYKAGDIWRSLTTADVIQINRSFLSLLWEILKAYPMTIKHLPDLLKMIPFFKFFNGFLDNKTLYNLLSDNINMMKIARNHLDTYICCTKLLCPPGIELTPVYFDIKNHAYTKEELIDIGLASSAIYPFFDKIKIGDSYYIDGGFTDNTPIRPLYDIGYRKFIIVYLNNQNPETAVQHESVFPNAHFIDIRPNNSLPTGQETTLNFNPEFIESFIQDGYRQTMNLSDEIASL